MRRWCAVLSLAFGLCGRPAVALPTVVARVPTSILIDAATGEPLAEHDADARRPAGSLNQLMVLLLSLEEAGLGALPLDVPVTVGGAAATDSAVHGATASEAPRIPLRADRAYLLSDLLKAVLVSSASNAALAIAEAIGGSVSGCLELMNARAQRLGMEATQYSSIGGIKPVALAAPDTTSARDLARLAQALVRNPQVLQWASLSGLPFDQGAVLLRNVNQLIGRVPGVNGLQVSASVASISNAASGRAASGRAASSRAASSRVASYGIVATAQRGALQLAAVVLDAPDSATRYSTAADLLEWGFAHYERLEIVRKGEPLDLPIRVMNGSVSQLTPVAGQTFSLLRQRQEERSLQVRYQLPSVLLAPLKRHQQIGEVIIEERGQLVAVVPVLSPTSVAATSVLSATLP